MSRAMGVAWPHRSLPARHSRCFGPIDDLEQLYGREREIEALLACFDRVVAHGTPELVLVSGFSGIGKSPS